jgi:glycosyltransferase involved in cell wall biosynthesis
MTPPLSEHTAPPGFLRLFVAFHESEALGAGRSVLNALEPLAAYGWTATGWFPGDGDLLQAAAASSVAAHARHPKPIRYSARGWQAQPGVFARLRGTPEYLRAFRRALLHARPHVVHANTLRTLPEARIARRLGLPVVMHVHELPPPGTKRTLALRAAANTADVLVAVSEAVAAILRPHAANTPVLVAYNGVPMPVARDRSPDIATVGTVGTICRTKGTDVFLRAAAIAHQRSPDLRFEHVGASGLDEDIAFERTVSALVESEELQGVVRLLGVRPAASELARWESFVLASRQDAFPLASLEAMAAGIPVIATNVGGLREQIEHLETGVLVEPERPEELAEWILQLHGDPALRERLASAGAARVRERFTIERQATVLHEAYLRALNLRHGPPPVRNQMLELA